MSETLDNVNGTGENKRPSFLTVLCILTFIGSGLGILGGLLGLVGSTALASFAPVGSSIIWTIAGLAASGLCLYGAIQMWGLKKSGFMMYVAGCAVAIIVSIISAMTVASAFADAAAMTSTGDAQVDALGASMTDAASSLASAAAWTSVGIGVAINVLFILLYNANRKHLVK